MASLRSVRICVLHLVLEPHIIIKETLGLALALTKSHFINNIRTEDAQHEIIAQAYYSKSLSGTHLMSVVRYKI